MVLLPSLGDRGFTMTSLALDRNHPALACDVNDDRFERVHLGFIPGLIGILAITNVISVIFSLMV
jgi:hypothetical protein